MGHPLPTMPMDIDALAPALKHGSTATRRRFTIDGDAALETHLERTCQRVREGVVSLVPSLEGLLLGGGYGRGEGGVLRTAEGDRPYNDLEFYVLIRGNAIVVERKFRDPLHELGQSLAADAGLEVEFKVLTREKLRRSPPSMFYYDLVAGHRWIIGEESLIAGCEHHRDPSAIPLHEATRLLFNRCSGLLFALALLNHVSFGAPEADFVGRNLAKAQLAFGDVLLAAHGEYHWSCRERHHRLIHSDYADGELTWAGPLKDLHAAGVDFKLHPSRSPASRETLLAAHTELCQLGKRLWLWLESRRLALPMHSPRAYAFSRADKCPETAPWRNRLLNFRTFGPAGLLQTRYPRERLFHALALLLWEPELMADSKLLGKARSELETQAGDRPGFIRAYWNLWSCFN